MSAKSKQARRMLNDCKNVVRMVLHCVNPNPDDPGLSERILAVLAALPNRERSCIELALGAGFTEREIAEQQGIGYRTVQRAIHDGLGVILAKVYDPARLALLASL